MESSRTSPSAPAVQVVPIEDLVADPANVRRRDERANTTLEASLRRFGPARSLVIDGKGVIRAGNGTIEAAAKAGVTEVVVVDPQPGQLVAVRRGDWSPSEATAYGIADNRTGELADWDNQGLAEQLRALQSEDFPVDDIGFTPLEVDGLCEKLGSDLIKGDVVDDPDGEWQGMPEYQHEDMTSKFRAIVHFANESDMREFESIVGQKIPENTRSIWYPEVERQIVRGSGYVTDEP